MRNKIAFIIIGFIVVMLYLVLNKNKNTTITINRNYNQNEKFIVKKIEYNNYFNNVIFDYINPYFIVYSEPSMSDKTILFKKINIDNGNINIIDTIYSVSRLMNFSENIIHGLSDENKLFLYDINKKEKIIFELPLEYKIIKSLYFNNNLIFLGEVFLEKQFITGFFNFDLNKKKLVQLDFLEKNKFSKFQENYLKYMGYFSPQNDYIGYTYNVLPQISLIKNLNSIETIELIDEDKAIYPIIDSYEGNFFYKKKYFYSQGFFTRKNSFYVISLMNIDINNNNILLDKYSNEGYIESKSVDIMDENINYFDMYSCVYKGQPIIITYKNIIKLN